MVKSDLCRLVMMYNLGGYYFDTDILPVKDLRKHLAKETTFATVVAAGGRSFFQAFLAASPKHPAILASLKEFKTWYDLLLQPGQSQEVLRKKTAEGNIGTALLRRAFKKWAKGAHAKAHMVHPEGHVSQFFVEDKVRNLKNFSGLPKAVSSELCDYAVVDKLTKSVVMFSRIYDKMKHKECQEEVRQANSG
ncbi:unnamed protein product [Effrenium voratum]|nr:unnamed protein product [Effrenium voratum]